jgi:hypothetical protein
VERFDQTKAVARIVKSPSYLVVLSILLFGMIQAKVAADDKKVPADFKTVVGGASTLVGYYSDAKGALDVARALGEVLGFLEPSVAEDQLRTVLDELNEVAAGINWDATRNFVDTHRAPLIGAMQRLKSDLACGRKQGQEEIPCRRRGDDDDRSTQDHTIALALGGSAFDRPDSDTATDTGPQGWKARLPVPGLGDEYIFYQTRDLLPAGQDCASPCRSAPNGLVYDWRIGIPVLLQAISYRLTYIAARDPNFRNDHLDDDELLMYESTLKTHLDIMLAGIKCAKGRDYEYPETSVILPWWNFGCADIHTGIEALWKVEDYTDADLGFNRPHWRAGQEVDWHEWNQHYFSDPDLVDRMRSKVMAAMPVFEMRSVIDSLYLYTHDILDLTELKQWLRTDGDLCVQTLEGLVADNTPVWLRPCNGDALTQQWIYDRKSSSIRNPPSGMCLTAGVVAGSPVTIGYCNGADAQRWTYDLDSRVLENGLGTRLDVRRPLADPPAVDGQMSYSIRIETVGGRDEAKTDAHIHLTLGSGQPPGHPRTGQPHECSSYPSHNLDSPGNDFEGGNIDTFTVLDRQLDALPWICIGFNRFDPPFPSGTGSRTRPGWFAKRIDITSLDTGKTWSFPLSHLSTLTSAADADPSTSRANDAKFARWSETGRHEDGAWFADDQGPDFVTYRLLLNTDAPTVPLPGSLVVTYPINLQPLFQLHADTLVGEQRRIVLSVYQGLLRRTPDAQEYDNALAYLAKGGTERGLRARLIARFIPSL